MTDREKRRPAGLRKAAGRYESGRESVHGHTVTVGDVSAVLNLYLVGLCACGNPGDHAVVGIVGVGSHTIAGGVIYVKVEVGVSVA